MKYFRVFLSFLLVCAGAGAKAAPTTSPFGINGCGWSHLGANTTAFDFATGARRLDSLAAMGVAWDRCDFWWHRIEPKPGEFVWKDYDRAVDAYEKAGVHVLPILCYDAAWHPGQSPNTPEYREEYGRFVFETVSHFKGRIAAYEIWNEPNGAQYWRPAPDAGAYTELLKVAHREAKRADPSVSIVGGAVAGMDWPFIEGMLKAGAAEAMDAISIHPYQGNLGSTSPEAGGLGADLRRLKELLKQHNGSKTRIWITEMGNRTVPDPYTPAGTSQPSGRVTEQQQANYLVRSYAIALSEGVERVFWFNLQDWPNETWGTITERDWRRKPSWYAYRAMAHMLTGKTFAASGMSFDDKHLLVFRDPAKWDDPSQAVVVGWAEGGGSAMEVLLDGTGSMYSPSASLSAMTSRLPLASPFRAVINEEPVYLTGDPMGPGLLPSAIRVQVTPAAVTPGDNVKLILTSTYKTVPVPEDIKDFQTKGLPVLYSRDSHTPIPAGLVRAGTGLRVGNVPAGEYLAGYRLPNGSVAACALRVVPALTVSVEPNPAEGKDLTLTMVNHSSRKLKATATVDMVGNRTDGLTQIEIGPHATMTQGVTNAQVAGARLDEPLPVSVSVAAPTGTATWSGNVYFWSAGVKAPGPPIVLDSAQDWQGQDGTWTSPDDLSVTMTARYDAQRLYLHADALDDVFSQPYALGEVWRGDAFQIAVDPNWTSKPDISDATEFGLALTPDGPQVYRWTGKAGLIPGADLKVKRDGPHTTYDASIPWSELGVKPFKAPKTIGFAFILNDNDGKDRQGWLMYGDGIATEKRADRYATLTLLP